MAIIEWVLKMANSVLFLTLNPLLSVLLGSGLLGTDLLSPGLLAYVLLGSGYLIPQLLSPRVPFLGTFFLN